MSPAWCPGEALGASMCHDPCMGPDYPTLHPPALVALLPLPLAPTLVCPGHRTLPVPQPGRLMRTSCPRALRAEKGGGGHGAHQEEGGKASCGTYVSGSLGHQSPPQMCTPARLWAPATSRAVHARQLLAQHTPGPLPSAPGGLRLLPAAPWRVPVLVLFRGGPGFIYLNWDLPWATSRLTCGSSADTPGWGLGGPRVRAHARRPALAGRPLEPGRPHTRHRVLLGTGVAATVVRAASRALGCRCLPSALAFRHLMFLKHLGGPSAVESPTSAVFRVWSIGSSQLTLGSRDCARGQRPAGLLVQGS